MIDGEEGFFRGCRKGLCHTVPDQKGGGQTGTTGRGEGIDVQGSQAGLPEGLFDQGTEDEGVIAGGHFRNDPAVGTMQGNLGRNEGGKDFHSGIRSLAQDGHRALITGCFDGQERGN